MSKTRVFWHILGKWSVTRDTFLCTFCKKHVFFSAKYVTFVHNLCMVVQQCVFDKNLKKHLQKHVKSVILKISTRTAKNLPCCWPLDKSAKVQNNVFLCTFCGCPLPRVFLTKKWWKFMISTKLKNTSKTSKVSAKMSLSTLIPRWSPLKHVKTWKTHPKKQYLNAYVAKIEKQRRKNTKKHQKVTKTRKNTKFHVFDMVPMIASTVFLWNGP